MVCCLLLFDDSPIPEDPRAYHQSTFQISMMDGLTKNQPVCCVTYFCAPCCNYYTRYRILEGDMTKYSCCQGYGNCCCFEAGCLGESNCPECCLCLESLCCLGPSMSSSRMFMMDRYELRSDPCDNRLIRFNNCLQLCACLCDILAAIDNSFRGLADLIDFTARMVFYCTLGCMAAQINYEVDFRKGQSYSGDASVMSPIAKAEPVHHHHHHPHHNQPVEAYPVK